MDNPLPADLVLKKILEVIPLSETEILATLTNYYNNELWNKAPELMVKGDMWFPLTRLLERTIGEIDADWKKTVVAIFNAGKKGELLSETA